MRHAWPTLVLCACAMLLPPHADAASVYVVRQGDTLWAIASRVGISVQQLAATNHLSLAAMLHPGDRLSVPDAGPAAPARAAAPSSTARGGAPSTYVVRQGDTLWTIAGHLGVGVQQLEAANRSLGATLHPGDRLSVPGAAPAAPAPAAAAGRPAALPAVGQRPAGTSAPARTSLPSRGVAFTSGIVRTAVRFLGRPYQWAGVGNHGFDCSGLVSRVFSAMGLAVPHSSYGQFRDGISVPRWALAPGDVVFFHTYGYGPSHVGIYVGAERFIHASATNGVVISSMMDPYYFARYLGARRF